MPVGPRWLFHLRRNKIEPCLELWTPPRRAPPLAPPRPARPARAFPRPAPRRSTPPPQLYRPSRHRAPIPRANQRAGPRPEVRRGAQPRITGSDGRVPEVRGCAGGWADPGGVVTAARRASRAGRVEPGRGGAEERRGPGLGPGRVQVAGLRLRPAGAGPGRPHRAPSAPGRGRGRGAAEARERGSGCPCTTFRGAGRAAVPRGGRCGAELSGRQARGWGETWRVWVGSCSRRSWRSEPSPWAAGAVQRNAGLFSFRRALGGRALACVSNRFSINGF